MTGVGFIDEKPDNQFNVLPLLKRVSPSLLSFRSQSSPFLASTIDLSTSTVDTDFIASRSMKRRRRRRRQKNCFNFAMAAFQLSGLRYLEPV